jgi:hypothetical protein
MMAKTAPRFAPLRAYKNRDENAKSCRRPPVDSAPFTNTYRRAVINHCKRIPPRGLEKEYCLKERFQNNEESTCKKEV